MILIASAAYVNSEFQIEFGRIPPSLIPLGNRRLYEYQIESLREKFPAEKIYLSLPEGYELGPKEIYYLDSKEIVVLFNDFKETLSNSIISALAKTEDCEGPIRILHGDTWIKDLPISLDCICVSKTFEDYVWEVESIASEGETIWCGYFSFSDRSILINSLNASKNDFSSAVRLYSDKLYLTRIFSNHWNDFGHINTYFKSRSKITTERVFNTLAISENVITKSGNNNKKIAAESKWFEMLPTSLRRFSPQLIMASEGSTGLTNSYSLEYLYMLPLNELYVHGRNPIFFWARIFNLLDEYLKICKGIPIEIELKRDLHGDFQMLAREKTERRLGEFLRTYKKISISQPLRINSILVPSLSEIIQNCVDVLSNSSSHMGWLHGDLCLSNILYDSRGGILKLIDPRGLSDESQITFFGDLRYDVAKLGHSIIGLYDHIISGAYRVKFETGIENKDSGYLLEIFTDNHVDEIQNLFLNHVFCDAIYPKDFMPMVVLLFLSMLPLHSDDLNRQEAFLANALRIYAKYLRKD